MSYYLTVKTIEFQQISLLTSWFSTTVPLTSFPTSVFLYFHPSFSPLSFTAPRLSRCRFPDEFLLSRCVGLNVQQKLEISLVTCAVPVTICLGSWACGQPACWEGQYSNLGRLHEIFYIAHNTGLGWENYAMPSPHFWLRNKFKPFGKLYLGLMGKDGGRGLIPIVREKQKRTCTERVRSFDFLHHIWHEFIQPTSVIIDW